MRLNVAGLMLLTAMGATPFHACSQEPESSSVPTAIGTDLPDDGTDAPVHLFWVTGDRIFRAECTGRTPILRSNCTEDMASRSYTNFKVSLDNGLSQTVRDLADEARRIQQAIVRLESEMAETLSQIAVIEREQGPLSQELEALRTQMTRFQAFVSEYREQLRLIDEALRRMANQDLQTQRTYMLRELSSYEAKLTDIARRIPGLMEQISRINTQLAALRDRLATVTVRLTNLKSDLADVSSRLEEARSDLEVYQTTLSMLTDGIIYHVLADDVLYQKNRLFVRRFERIFDAG